MEIWGIQKRQNNVGKKQTRIAHTSRFQNLVCIYILKKPMWHRYISSPEPKGLLLTRVFRGGKMVKIANCPAIWQYLTKLQTSTSFDLAVRLPVLVLIDVLCICKMTFVHDYFQQHFLKIRRGNNLHVHQNGTG